LYLIKDGRISRRIIAGNLKLYEEEDLIAKVTNMTFVAMN